MSKCRGLVALAFFVLALTPAFSQKAISFPSWLENYPGTTPDVRSGDSLIETTYIAADAQPMEVEQHYRELFEAHGLNFAPYWDGMGILVRAEARECVLLIVIRSRPEGTLTKVSCAAKADASSYLAPSQIPVMGGHPKTEDSADSADKDGGNRNPLPPVKFNRAPHDMPPPALEWPSWLKHVRGEALQPTDGTDPAGNGTLTVRYKTDAPMTEISGFYRNLLLNHDYRPQSEIPAGHAAKGTQPSVPGHLEGVNYPGGYPGAFTGIEVSMARSGTDGPSTVTLRFSAHGYTAAPSASSPKRINK